MLDIFGGGVILALFWVAVVLCITLVAGCDSLVADNPACTYDCVSTQSYARNLGGY